MVISYNSLPTDYNSIYNDRLGAHLVVGGWVSTHFRQTWCSFPPKVPPGQIGGLGWWVWDSRDTPKEQIPFIRESQQSKPLGPKRPIKHYLIYMNVNIIPGTCLSQAFDSRKKHYTLPETNMAPKNGWLEYYVPFRSAYFQGPCFFQGV